MMPPGADVVVPVEDTDAPAGASKIPATVEILRATRRGANVRRPGTDVVAGAALLDRGRACRPGGHRASGGRPVTPRWRSTVGRASR